MFHQPAGRLVPSTILESTGFVHFFLNYSVPFVCVHVFFCCKYPERDPVLGLYQVLVLSSSALSWGFGCCWGEVKQWVSCVEALLDGLLSSADFQGISLEIYQCKGKNQFCSNFIACTYGTGVSSVGVIVCNLMYFTNKVRKTRAYILVSQNFQIFFHVNLSGGFLLQILELAGLFQY